MAREEAAREAASESAKPGAWLSILGGLVVLVALVLAGITVSEMDGSGFGAVDYTTSDKMQAAALVGVVPAALGFLMMGLSQVINQLHRP